jgi:ectoine hydroxylase-related dioxygenase (phytanoyl-CoA dioxygenase family)
VTDNATDAFGGYTHTDGGEGLREIRVTETSRPLAMKAMYLLSDVAGPDCGAFTVYPGSHMRPFPWRREERLTPHSPGAVQLPGRAGDCYLFPHALWHGPAPNHSGWARKTLLYVIYGDDRGTTHRTGPQVTPADQAGKARS